jgi:UDP-N-acetylglucosamine diphosphorylase / glucose-1-phosphate thymidylyltransferase / UDP-N-acetylgalactosamine diphosphorylase / glucosamine-1-phosphate N-acetyltransferase / galactosamine-1-phosphate N-acetyltransferase
MQIVLFDNKQRKKLYPLTLNRAVADLKTGIFSNKERWEFLSGIEVKILTEDYLQTLYNDYPSGDILLIDASVIFNETQAKKILELPLGYYVSYSKGFIAGRFNSNEPFKLADLAAITFDKAVTWKEEVNRLDYPWQIFANNNQVLIDDFALVTIGRKSAPISNTNQYINPSNIFIEEGAKVEFSILNASNGPIYIAKNAVVMEGCLIRGSLALGENSVLKMGAKIYGSTTIANNCIVGGEIKNSVIFANSNKAHDGYLGDSVIGEWCNLGAGTSISNVKNTGGLIKITIDDANNEIVVGQKCGAIVGDFTRIAINSSINTGSIIGVCCNVFGNGLLPKKIANFSWGIQDEEYIIDKAIEDINNWQHMKQQQLSQIEINIIHHIYSHKNNN